MEGTPDITTMAFNMTARHTRQFSLGLHTAEWVNHKVSDNMPAVSHSPNATAFSPDWPAFYHELAQALLEYEQRQPELVQLLESVGVHVNNDEGKTLQEIDPLTFLSLLTKYRNPLRWQAILQGVKNALHLKSPVPVDSTGLPNSEPRSSWLFPYRSWRHPQDVPTLWKLTREALEGKILPETFSRALRIGTVGLSKLTMGLFWLDTQQYLALNSKNVNYLTELGLPDTGSVNSLEAYLATLERARSYAGSFLELSHRAWQVGQPVKPPATFPFDELMGLTRTFRERVQAALDAGAPSEAQSLLKQGQGELYGFRL